jgi:hypothetical protein
MSDGVALLMASGTAAGAWLATPLPLLLAPVISGLGLRGQPCSSPVSVSSAFVAVGTLSGWVPVFARNNPLTAVIDAVRNLAIGRPAATALVHTLIWGAALVLVFGVAARWLWERRA